VVFNRRRSLTHSLFLPGKQQLPFSTGVFTQSASFVLETLLEWRFSALQSTERERHLRVTSTLSHSPCSFTQIAAYLSWYCVGFALADEIAVADVLSQLQVGTVYFVVTFGYSSWNDMPLLLSK
jgi:hypothetical protein